MSISGQFNIQTIFTEGFLQNQQFSSSINPSSPGKWESTSLASGNNSFVIPAGTSGFGIIPPVSNTTVTLILKGVSGDTGIPLGSYNPSVFGINNTTSTTSVVITASGTLPNVRLVYL